MACTTMIQGTEIDCLDSVGGIDTIYITEFTNVPQANITEASGVISAMTCSAGKKFWTFSVRKNTSQVDEEVTNNAEAGTSYVEQKLTFDLLKITPALRYTIKTLAVNRLMVIVKDRNGLIKLYGKTTGMDLSAGSLTSGKAMTDKNGATITLTGMEPDLSPSLSTAILATVTV
jgi:hypothetical protein